MAARLTIVPAKDALPSHTPNLMPFHIDYSGPAPISTYMRAKPTRDIVGAPEPAKNAGDGSSATGNASESRINENDGDSMREVQSMEVDASQSSGTGAGVDVSKRFVSSFRGRIMHGLDINLPEGYGGLILRTEDHGVNSTSESLPKRREESGTIRITRRLKRIVARDEEGEVELEMSEKVVQKEEVIDLMGNVDEDEDDEKVPTRMLRPTAQFSSFRLWNADRPADGGVDEYARSLTEWIRLANLIHQHHVTHFLLTTTSESP